MGRGAETDYGAFRTVKASDAEHHEGQRIHAAACDAWRPDVAAAKWQAIAGNTSGLAIQGAFIAVLATGGVRVASGALGVSILMACLLHVHYLMAPIEQWSVLPANTRWAARRWQGLRRLNGGRWNPPPFLQAAAAPQRRSRSRRSAFRNRPELPEVHHSASVAIPHRGMTAFIGLSGAGKTGCPR